jgi:acyl-CoA synthetase (NDP forming)
VTSLFDPASVAVIGASENKSKWGYWLAAGALRGRHRRTVTLVNRSGGAIDGVDFVPALDTPVDLAVISVPAAGFLAAVTSALEAGASAVVGVTAGVPAADAEQARLLVRESGARLLGPNCMGVASAADELQLLWGDLPAGSIGLLSQSGNLAIELGMIARRSGLGFSRFASLGDALDLSAVDLLPEVAEGARAVALYLEDVGDGRAFVDTAAELVRGGTPVVLLTAGRSAAGARAAASHTGALASDSRILEVACRAAGVILVDSPTKLLEMTRVSAAMVPGRQWWPAGTRVGIVADGGGHGVIAADLAAARGLSVPALRPQTQSAIAAMLPPTASATNPVDLAGGGERDLRTYAAVPRVLADSGDVDAVLVTGYFGGYAADLGGDYVEREGSVADALAEVSGTVPVVVHSMAADSVTGERLSAGGVPVWFAVEDAISALASRAPADPAPRVDPQPPVAADADPYWAGRALLAEAGVECARALEAGTLDEVRKAGAELGFPLVLKAMGLAHKSDVGGVALGLETPDALGQACADMLARLDPVAFSVEEMVPAQDTIEMIVGARRDPRFGPVVLAGFGGVLTEVLDDSAVDLAPVTRDRALAMLDRLRGVRLLDGFRGGPAVSRSALADVIVAVSRIAAAHPEIAEFDVNPVLVGAGHAVALDAHLAVASVGPRDEARRQLPASGSVASVGPRDEARRQLPASGSVASVGPTDSAGRTMVAS